MEILELVLAAAGAVGLFIGYRKNSRNVLLASALVLSCAFGLADFSSGFRDGFQHSVARQL